MQPPPWNRVLSPICAVRTLFALNEESVQDHGVDCPAARGGERQSARPRAGESARQAVRDESRPGSRCAAQCCVAWRGGAGAADPGRDGPVVRRLTSPRTPGVSAQARRRTAACSGSNLVGHAVVRPNAGAEGPGAQRSSELGAGKSRDGRSARPVGVRPWGTHRPLGSDGRRGRRHRPFCGDRVLSEPEPVEPVPAQGQQIGPLAD